MRDPGNEVASVTVPAVDFREVSLIAEKEVKFSPMRQLSFQ